MPQFGDYEVIQQLPSEAKSLAYIARKAGQGDKLYFVRVFQTTSSPTMADARLGAQEHLDEDLQLLFLEAVKQQKRAVEAGAKHVAPIREFGKTGEGAWYATELFERGTINKLITGKAKVDSETLSHVIGSILAGLVELKRKAGRFHGGLRSRDVLLAGKKGEVLQLRATSILLTDLRPGLEPFQGAFEVFDLQAVGKIIYQLVFRQEVEDFDEINHPLPPSAEWNDLGKEGDYWRNLCDRLLNPNLQPGQESIEKLAHQIKPLRNGKGSLLLLGIGVACVFMLAVGVLLMRKSSDRHTPPTDVKQTNTTKPATQPNNAQPIPSPVVVVKSNPPAINNTGPIVPTETVKIPPVRPPPPVVQPPTIVPSGPYVVKSGQSVSVVLSANDPQKMPLTFRVSDDVKNGALSGTPPNLVYTPKPEFAGADGFQFEVSNQQSAPARSAVVIKVIKPPTLPPIDNQVVTAEQAIDIVVQAIDKTTPSQSLKWQVDSDNRTLLPDGLSAAYVTGSQWRLKGKPAPNQSGKTTITLTVANQDNLSAQTTFVLTVNPKPKRPAPQIAATTIVQSLAAGQKPNPFVFTVKTDATAALIAKLAASPPDLLVVADQNVRHVLGAQWQIDLPKPTKTIPGAAKITLLVADPTDPTLQDIKVFTVEFTNTPPRIDQITPASLSLEVGATAQASLDISDIESKPEALVLAASVKPAEVASISVPTTERGSHRTAAVSGKAAGNAVATFVVKDEHGMEASKTFQIVVKAPPPPPPPPPPAKTNEVVTPQKPPEKPLVVTPQASQFANPIGMVMIWVPDLIGGGPVNGKNGAWVGQYEVTEAEYAAVMKDRPSTVKAGDRFPVVGINQSDAIAFCKRLTDLDQKKPAGWSYQLPSSPQWRFYADDAESENGVTAYNAAKFPNNPDKYQMVGQVFTNKLRLCDVIGNVWELTRDTAKNAKGEPQAIRRGGNFKSRGGAAFLGNGVATTFNYLWPIEGDVMFDATAATGFRVILAPTP